MNMEEDCIFCKMVNGDVPVTEVYDDDNFFAFLDNNPLVEGHTLIIPKRHYNTVLDMPSSLGGELLDAIKKVGFDLIKEGKAESINLAVIGEDVKHAHVHVIPRKDGDGVKVLSKEGK